MAKRKAPSGRAPSAEAADTSGVESGIRTSSAAASQQGALDAFFGLSAQGTNIATEFRAGLPTFLSMAYIMFVNPAILEKAGMEEIASVEGAIEVDDGVERAAVLAFRLGARYRSLNNRWHSAPPSQIRLSLASRSSLSFALSLGYRVTPIVLPRSFVTWTPKHPRNRPATAPAC